MCICIYTTCTHVSGMLPSPQHRLRYMCELRSKHDTDSRKMNFSLVVGVRELFMSPVNRNLSSIYKEYTGNFMACSKSHMFARVFVSLPHWKTKTWFALLSYSHCPSQVTWLGQPHQGPLVSNNNQLISRMETKRFPLSRELAPSPRAARQGRLKQWPQQAFWSPGRWGGQPWG